VSKELDDIRKWRERIDEIDAVLVKLLNERAVCAEEIGKVKILLGLEVYSPDREKEVMRNVTSENPGPLKDEAVVRLFERIIDESRSIERVTVEKTKKKKK
jgi:chorismate mutase